MDIELCVQGPVYTAATWDHLFLEYFNGEASIADFRKQSDLQRTFAQRLGADKIVSLTYVGTAKFSAPDKASRELIAASADSLSDSIAATAVVVPAKGFAPAIIRGVLASVSLLSRRRTKSEVFADVAGACAFLATHSTMRADKMQEAVNELIRIVKA